MLKGESERKMNKKINSQVLLIDMKEAAYEECIDRLLKLDKNNEIALNVLNEVSKSK